MQRSVSESGFKVYHIRSMSERTAQQATAANATDVDEYCLEVSRKIRASPCSGRDDSKSVPNLIVSRRLCLICVYSPSFVYFASLYSHACVFSLFFSFFFPLSHPHQTALTTQRERERGGGVRERETTLRQ